MREDQRGIIADMARLDQFINGVRDGDEQSISEASAWIMNAVATDPESLLVIMELLRLTTEVCLENDNE